MKDCFNKIKLFVENNKRAFFWLRIIVTIGLFGFILSLLHIKDLISLFEKARIETLLLAFVLIALHITIKSFKWFVLTRTVDTENTFSSALFSYLHGTGLAIVTPARIGELGRIFYLKGDKIKLTSLTIVDKLFELFAVIVLVLFGSLNFIQNSYVIYAILLSLVIFLAIVFNLKKLSAFIGQYIKFPFIRRSLDSLKQLSPSLIFLIFLLSLVVMMVYLLQVFLIMNSFVEVSFSTIFAVFPLVLLTNLVPFTTASIGVRESAAIVLLAHFGIASEVAVSTTTLILIFDTVVPGLIGSFGAANIKEK